MTEWLHPGPGSEEMRSAFKVQLRAAIVTLLETRHLYQSVDFASALSKEINALKERITPWEQQDDTALVVWGEILDRWYVLDVPARRMPFKDARSAPKALMFEVPSANLFCGRCVRTQAFNPTSTADLFEWSIAPKVEKPSKNVVQTFVLSFQCQSCKGEPEAFLIRREQLKLTLGGRIPIEQVDVPKVIPKGAAARYYGQAVVAFDAGFVLAGLFYLRVLIEQYSIEEAKTDKKKVVGPKGEPPLTRDFIDAYMDGLDEDLKKRAPSFRKLYEDLSGAIHTGNESPELFDTVKREIDVHFEGKEWLKKVGKAR